MNEHLENFIKLAEELRVQTKERTIFSLGGRGYYENATSDILAFFLRPDAEHEFGNMFLSALFECMGEITMPDLSGATVEREIQTAQGNRIDLQIRTKSWCLLVENKIWHIKNNPFDDYETHAKLLSKQTYFAVLSPDGGHPDGWKGISYTKYCAVLRERLGKALFDAPHSKWHLFARELILHIENELYTPAMNPTEITFVEKHTADISKVQKLMSQYRTFFLQKMKSEVGKRFPEFNAQIWEDSWPGHIIVFRCTSPQWKKNDMVVYKPEGEGQKFATRIYVDASSESRVNDAKRILENKATITPGVKFPYWTFPGTHGSAKEAITEFCDFVEFLKPVLTS